MKNTTIVKSLLVLIVLSGLLAAPAALARFHAVCDTTNGWGDHVHLEVDGDELQFSGEVHCDDAGEIVIHHVTLTSVATGETWAAGPQVTDDHSTRRAGSAPLGDGVYDLSMEFQVSGTNDAGEAKTFNRDRRGQWVVANGELVEVCGSVCLPLID